MASVTTSVAQPPTIPTTPPDNSNSTPSPTSTTALSGKQISLNDRTFAAAWHQWLDRTGKISTAIDDTGLMQLVGVELLNTKNPAKQPIVWFSQSTPSSLILNSWQSRMYRYLNVTQLAKIALWRMQVDGETLRISTPASTVKGIRQGKQTWGDRIVLDLDRPTPWQVTQQKPAAKPKPLELLDDPNSRKLAPQTEWLVTIDATLDPNVLPELKPSSSISKLELKAQPNLTAIRLSLPAGVSPRVSTLANPNRIVIDLRPDAMVERDILWSEGLRWRQQFVTLGSDRFPVVWLEINPRHVGVTLKPISSDTNSLIGIAPISQTAQRYFAAAAINGGFFNRRNKLPLGAIRRDGRWLSSPILNRGAIALNDFGQIKIGRLGWRGNLITSTGQRLPVVNFNSGYVSAGISLYSTSWGSSYTPLIDNEVIVVVQSDRVTAQLPGGIAGKTAFPIPPNGYLLALRASNSAILPVGTIVRQQLSTIPADFARYPQILGAGPLLLQNRSIVLDGKAESFSDAFMRQTAVRSAICTTAAGNAIVATIHNRAGGSGSTLAETAKIVQSLGCTDALNLDGGSSTSLYLGGQLLNRSPLTAARVHNGLGIFLQPRP